MTPPLPGGSLVALALLAEGGIHLVPPAMATMQPPTITEILARCPHPTVRRGSYADHAAQFPELAEERA